MEEVNYSKVQDPKQSSVSIDNEPDKKMPKNPWVISTIVLAFIALILLFFILKGGNAVTGNVIVGEEAGKKLVEYLNAKTIGGVEFVSFQEAGNNLYQVIVSYREQEIPVYVTKDGEYFVQAATPMINNVINEQVQEQETPKEETSREVPKSDKPKVEAFVFSYCPYGLQFEKALLLVYNLLKNKADIEIVAIGAMHGEYEKQESLRQICIQKEYGKDKLWKYLEKFMADTKIGDCKDNMECSKPLVEKLMTSLGIDKNKINTCIGKDAEALYKAQNDRASSLGIGGSPTFVINNVESQAARTPEAIKTAVCNAFSTLPSECSQTLSAQAVTPWFGSLTSEEVPNSHPGGSC